jgi:hypothetical protein
MERCHQCKKVLFRKKDGTLACPNGCDDNQDRLAFNTAIQRKNVAARTILLTLGGLASNRSFLSGCAAPVTIAMVEHEGVCSAPSPFMGWFLFTAIAANENGCGLDAGLPFLLWADDKSPFAAITLYPAADITAFAQTITICSHTAIMAANYFKPLPNRLILDFYSQIPPNQCRPDPTPVPCAYRHCDDQSI